MAASRTAQNITKNAARRISFAKIKEPLEVPNLLALQTESFDWLVGNATWKGRVSEQQAAGLDVPTSEARSLAFQQPKPSPQTGLSLARRDRFFTPPATRSMFLA